MVLDHVFPTAFKSGIAHSSAEIRFDFSPIEVLDQS